MKIKMIDVLTSNKKHATDIVMLVDQSEFLQEIQRLRQKWQITELYKLQELLGISALLDMSNPLFYTGINRDKIEEKLPEFNSDIDKLLKKFNRGKNYRQVVLYALVTGVVPDKVYQSCYFDVITINDKEDLSKPEKYQYVIVLSPRTEKQEVIDSYKEFKNHIKGKIKFHQPRIPLESEATKEFYEAMDCIEKEKKLYEEEVEKLKTPEEIKKTLTKYMINTKDAREYLLQIGNLNLDIPDHQDLIEQYHRGEVHEYDDIDKHKTLKQFHRNREFYMISYEDVLEGKSEHPLTAKYVFEKWLKKCPLNGHLKPKDEGRVDCVCQYCTLFDINTIEKGVEAYIEFLEKINKTSLNS